MRVDVEWHASKGFVGTAFELKRPVIALTLSGLKQRLQTLFPDAMGIEFRLDRTAQREQDGRRESRSLERGARRREWAR